MNTFNNAFEQFKKNAFNLALINLLYTVVVTLGSFVLNGFIPIVGPFLYLALVMVSIPVYVRILMQVVNGRTSTSIDDAMQGIAPVAGKIFLLNFLKGIISTLVAIPCIALSIGKIISMLMYDSSNFESIIGVFMSLWGAILIVIIVSLILELILGFVTMLISDEDFSRVSFKDSLVNGIKMMKGYRVRFVFIQVINVFLMFLGFLMLGVGIFFTSPLSTLLTLNLYKEAKDNYFGYNNRDNDITSSTYDSVESNEESVEFNDFLKKD